jgi:type IV pilus assembly protein PilO
MPDVKDARRKLTLVLAILLCVDIACGVILISPIGRSARSSQQRLEQLWSELQKKTIDTVPLQGIDQKVKDANLEIQQFYSERLPQRYANIIDELGKVAGANNVKIANAKYQTEDSEIPGLRRVLIDATLSGDYVQEARFINAMERDKMFFIIDSVALGEQSQQGGGGVRLQIRLETYIRNEAAA